MPENLPPERSGRDDESPIATFRKDQRLGVGEGRAQDTPYDDDVIAAIMRSLCLAFIACKAAVN